MLLRPVMEFLANFSPQPQAPPLHGSGFINCWWWYSGRRGGERKKSCVCQTQKYSLSPPRKGGAYILYPVFFSPLRRILLWQSEVGGAFFVTPHPPFLILFCLSACGSFIYDRGRGEGVIQNWQQFFEGWREGV